MKDQRRDVTGHELLAGAPLPIELDLRVEITGGEPSDGLPPGIANALRGHEKQLMAWLARGRARRVEFLADPLAALEQAGVELEPEARETLRELHAQRAATDVLPPGVSLASLRVDLAPKAAKD